ncbi:MAG TPA: dynamin family protein, partial [Pseudonocardiaceae bacterium]|nr:dynamin family protein [Pseudonocardiaceae bacterium]
MTAGTNHHDPTAVLAAIADRVHPLLPPDRRAIVEEALARVRIGRVRVLVLGEAKRGKSTLVNSLFDADLLPTGALPLTSVATVVTVGTPTRAQAHYQDGRVEEIRLDQVAGLVSERGNPSNTQRVDRVTIVAPSPHLPAGTDVVDTPGTGSVHLANTEEATRARATVDLAVLVVAADPPVSAAELVLARDVLTTAAATAVVVNKTDLAIPDAVGEIVAFTRDAVTNAVDTAVPVFPMSLRAGATGGVDALIEWVTERLAVHGHRDVLTSTGRALRREATAVLDGLRVEHELLRSTEHDSAVTVAALREILDQASAAADTAADHLRAEARRARARLDDQHDREVAAAMRAARVELGTALPDGTASPEQRAAELRERIEIEARRRCAAWFDRIAPDMAAMLHRAAEHALTGLDRHLVAARQAAEQALHLRLTPVESLPATPPPRLPRLETGPAAVWQELVTSALARRLPAAVRRRRLHTQLRERASGAVSRPFGRTRSAVQDWLADTTRMVERDLSTAWRTHLAALEQGLREAERHRQRTDAEITGALAA